MIALPHLGRAALLAVLLAALLALTAGLRGCAGPAQLVTNDKASDEIKAKSFMACKEVPLIAPKEVNKTINPASVVQATGGVLPQNVNFAIKNGPVLDFMKGADGAAFDARRRCSPPARAAAA